MTSDAERDDAFRACERFLFGHGAQRPRDVLVDLVEEAGPEEDADRYGEGSLINDFEREVATLLGTEAALFLPSGTMAQQIALRIWADRTHSAAVAFHPTCHLEIHEQKGYALLHGLHGHLVGERTRLLTLADLHAAPESLAALLLELPQREIGGELPAWEDLQAQVSWARERGIKVHMDGARLWESAPFYGRAYAEIAALFDSVYVSFYKGIGAIAGAALAGSNDVIAEARLWQRRHGGNLVQLYPLVLSARRGLRRRLSSFEAYHDRALALARVLTSIPGISASNSPESAKQRRGTGQVRRTAVRFMPAASSVARRLQ